MKVLLRKIIIAINGVTLIVIFILLTYACIRIFIADRFVIPSTSMMPTLKPGDDIMVNKMLMGARIYTTCNFRLEGGTLKCFRLNGLRRIRMNDIVVCNKYKFHDSIKFVLNNLICKRCIGLPGDTISIRNGFYHNNNYDRILCDKAQQTLLATKDSSDVRQVFKTFPKKQQIEWTIKDFGPYYVPRKDDMIFLNSKTATIYKVQLEWELGKTISINKELDEVYADGERIYKHKFQHNYYFLAGDNVLDSDDSRYRGPIPEEYIIGIATKILYSKDEEKGECRWERFLKSL